MDVVPVGQHFAQRGPAVSPGATDFLAVVFDRFRQIVVDDSADVFLIDAHSKSDGCNDTGHSPVHEFVLNPFPLLGFHPGMIRMRVDLMLAEKFGDLFCRFLQGYIDNGRVFWRFIYSLEQAVLFFNRGRRGYLQRGCGDKIRLQTHFLFGC